LRNRLLLAGFLLITTLHVTVSTYVETATLYLTRCLTSRSAAQVATRRDFQKQAYLDSSRKDFLSIIETAQESDCSRIFGPSVERSVLRATMEVARGDANCSYDPVLREEEGLPKHGELDSAPQKSN
jgi:hypothetical protein